MKSQTWMNSTEKIFSYNHIVLFYLFKNCAIMEKKKVSELAKKDEIIKQLQEEKTIIAAKVQSISGRAGAYKKLNEQLKLQVESVEEALNKKRVQHEEAVKEITRLKEEVFAKTEELKAVEKALEAEAQDKVFYKNNYEHFLAMSWYKRMFAK